jgi:4a-hydroxytetrahydrobiopterin dehydratase
MMTDLLKQTCIPCSGSSSPVSINEMADLKQQLPNWEIVKQSGELHLQRCFALRDFKTALAFTQHVGEESESEGHHPALLTEWGKVTVTWWTHAIHGLHRNDFIMAARTDQIATHFMS